MKTVKYTFGLAYSLEVEFEVGKGGKVVSDFKEPCNHCGDRECNYDCDGSKGADDEHEDDESRAIFNAKIDIIESFILAQAVAGIDIESKEYVESLNTVMDALVNNHIFDS